MLLLYLVGIVVSWIFGKKRRKKKKEEDVMKQSG